MARKSVKVVESTSAENRAQKNYFENLRVAQAKRGDSAFIGAKVGNAFIKGSKAIGSKTPTVKINSANPTRQGTTPVIRKAGGLMGGGTGGSANWRLNK